MAYNAQGKEDASSIKTQSDVVVYAWENRHQTTVSSLKERSELRKVCQFGWGGTHWYPYFSNRTDEAQHQIQVPSHHGKNLTLSSCFQLTISLISTLIPNGA